MTTEKPKENCLDTFCGTCVFAQYDANNIQCGCHSGMLFKLLEQQKNIEAIEHDEYISNKIEGALCYYWRSIAWKVAQGIDEDIDTLLQIARTEMTLSCDIVVYCDGNTSYEQLKTTLDSIKALDLKQRKIYLLNDGMSTVSKFATWANEELQGIPWRVEFVVNTPANMVENATNELRILDVAGEKCEARFIAFFKAGFVVPPDFLRKIDIALHDEYDRFILLEPIDTINGLFVMRHLSKTLVGSKYGPIVEQTRILAEEQECPKMIRKVTEIVPSMLESESLYRAKTEPQQS